MRHHHCRPRLGAGWRTISTYDMVRVGDLGDWSAHVSRAQRADATQTASWYSFGECQSFPTMSIRNTPFMRDLILAVYSYFSSYSRPREASYGKPRMTARTTLVLQLEPIRMSSPTM
jgi:hypothetical protein